MIEQRIVTVKRCPPELLATFPAAPARPAGGAIEGDEATLNWLGQIKRWGEALFGRLVDAQAQCS